MNKRKPDNSRRWARAWRIAGSHLAGERARGLRALDDDEARRIIAHIFSGPAPARVERKSGLVRQQQLFRKLK